MCVAFGNQDYTTILFNGHTVQRVIYTVKRTEKKNADKLFNGHYVQ